MKLLSLIKYPVEGRRIRHPLNDDYGDDGNGCFIMGFNGRLYKIIASSGYGWEHISVSSEKFTPGWEVMCRIKNMFFNDDEVVMQLHPAKKDYINNCTTCLHLWRPLEQAIPLPPKEFV